MTPLRVATRLFFHPARSIKAPFSRCFTSNRLIQNGDVVILREQDSRGSKFYLSPPLIPETGVKIGGSRTVQSVDIIGKQYRDVVLDDHGRRYRLHEASLAAYILLRPRRVTPIYPGDANTIVSMLDLHLPSPGEDPLADSGPPLEILEAGTGHGSLTLHLARAIHGANPPVPPSLRAALAAAAYVSKSDKQTIVSHDEMESEETKKDSLELKEESTEPKEELISEDSGLNVFNDVELHSPPSVEVSGPEDQDRCGQDRSHTAPAHNGPHRLIPPDAATAASLSAYLHSRRAILHTLDIDPHNSHLAHRHVCDYRRAQYLLDVDFHVGGLHGHLRSRLEQTGGLPFLSHVVLDLPGFDRAAAELLARAMHADGALLLFSPSVSQLVDYVAAVAEVPGRAFLTDRIVELHTSTFNGTGMRLLNNSPVSGRDWSVNPVVLPQDKAAGVENPKTVYSCRPQVGGRVVGGGFVGLFRRAL